MNNSINLATYERVAVISSNAVAKTFSEGSPLQVEVLRSVDLEVHPSERVAIVGASGSGKSTLLHILGGLDLPSRGTVKILGQDITRLSNKARGTIRNQSLGFVYQFHHLLPEFTALENVAMPLFIRGESRDRALESANLMLDLVGLKPRALHKPAELSGGERQRVAIARALVGQPKCLMADEPTGNLDRGTAETVFEIIMSLNRRQETSLIIVTHDERIAARMDKVYLLQDGCLQKQ